ncbi:hypothetical protein BH09SUM1_BH09SUM1_22330 [soil metagenome]
MDGKHEKGGNSAAKLEKIESEVEAGVESLTGRAKEVFSKVADNVGAIRENVSHYREVGQQKLGDAYEKVSSTSLSDVQSSVDNYVRQRPVKSLLIAVAAGAVLGMLLRSGSNKD